MNQIARDQRRLRPALAWTAATLLAIVLSSACSGGLTSDRDTLSSQAAESCMLCHNGSASNDYSGPGMTNPHPFPGAEAIRCTTCHGGDPTADTKEGAHVPPPPSIGDRQRWDNNAEAYFNRLTLAGLDKIGTYVTAAGRPYTGLDYLQWVNPGDIRVVSEGRSCGQCHTGHADVIEGSLLYNATGFFGGTNHYIGVDNAVPENVGLYHDTGADLAFRAVVDPNFVLDPNRVGPVGRLEEQPVYSRRVIDPQSSFRNNDYLSPGLSDDQDAEGRVITNSPLHHLFTEQVSFTCGDCHLGSAGANNRSADYRSAGCTACHMPYAITGRYGIQNDPLGNPLTPIQVGQTYGSDPHISSLRNTEPADPDDIDDPELPHVREHRIVSVKRTLSNGVEVAGMDDYTCAGCHQGSNRTVMQYWGIRLDQNEDLRRGVQYPAQPVSFRNTNNDSRLFVEYIDYRDPNNVRVRRTQEFNGRDRNQYILDEDYDGDGRDDTPPDIHYEAGMGCIDCHGSYDLHGGDPTRPTESIIASRMEHAVSIECEDCHGTVDDYAQTQPGVNYRGETRDLVVDSEGNLLRHVQRESDGHVYLYSKLTGQKHFVVQTKDVVVDSGVINPVTSQPVFSSKASYAMGRDDGDPSTGIGPKQTGTTSTGFSHSDNMSCASCHSSWQNSCVGCHLIGEYNEGNNFSNITGERIAFREDEADFTYQSPVFMQLGVGPNNKIEQLAANTKVFFTYRDRNNVTSEVFAFSDRQGYGNNQTMVPYPSLGHNKLTAHSIRGKVDSDDEGPRYCVACHLTTDGMSDYGSIYSDFRTRMANDDFANLDFAMIRQHIGLNPGNQINSPVWVHHVAGLGSGLFLFDQNGAPVNPLDNDNNRQPYDVAPATVYDPNNVVYNLDKIVLPDGTPTGSNNHAMMVPPSPLLRDGAPNPEFAGPLGTTLIRRLTDPTTGIVLDSWLDADGQDGGDSATHR
jgi:hypothetical protein